MHSHAHSHTHTRTQLYLHIHYVHIHEYRNTLMVICIYIYEYIYINLRACVFCVCIFIYIICQRHEHLSKPRPRPPSLSLLKLVRMKTCRSRPAAPAGRKKKVVLVSGSMRHLNFDYRGRKMEWKNGTISRNKRLLVLRQVSAMARRRDNHNLLALVIDACRLAFFLRGSCQTTMCWLLILTRAVWQVGLHKHRASEPYLCRSVQPLRGMDFTSAGTHHN